ncbi:MAG: asparagine synthase (glutamine-hydrolyzing), partial [Candidatus Margulisiibacteriota bacterium]
ALNALKNRGPDSNGWVCFDDELTPFDSRHESDDLHRMSSHAFCGAFVHTRLSILDLSSFGHQPMSDPSNQFWITYNGEVYNFQEVKDELVSIGWAFKSQSDTEVILKAYIQWGEECVKRFNGMFAFVILDIKAQQLFCARDRIGIKPFYYIHNGVEFLFASDVTTLIATNRYQPKINWDNVMAGYELQGAPRPTTVYQDVFSLDPGHTMTVSLRDIKIEKQMYWDLPIGETLSISYDDAKDALDEKLKKAINNTLVSDVEVATLMSGGIDSTTMSVLANMAHPNIKTFTLSFDEILTTKNELENAKLVASQWNINHQIKVLSSEEMVNDLDDMQLTFEEPIGVLEPHYPMAKCISNQGIKVLLNGLGPDELLGGYSKYRWIDYWKKYRWQRLFSWGLPNQGKLSRLKKLLNSESVFDAFCLLHKNQSSLRDGVFSRVSKDQNQVERMFKVKDSDFSDEIQAASYLDFKLYIGTHHNHTTDRFLMRFGMEGRFPFLDHELVEFCFKLPKSFKYKNKVGKKILRSVAEKYIHPNCLSAKKMGFVVPEKNFMSPVLKDKVHMRLNELSRRNYFKPDMIHYIKENMDKSEAHAKDALYLANFELWYKSFIEKKHPMFNV